MPDVTSTPSPTIIATDKGAYSNCYLTMTEAEVYFGTRLNVEAWNSADLNTKVRALLWATRILDDSMDWRGVIRTREQALKWPRSAVRDDEGRNVPYEVVPTFIKNATADLALAFIERNRTAEPKLWGQGFSSAKSPAGEITVDKTAGLDLIPRFILVNLAPYGALKPIAGYGGGSMKLERA